MPTGTLSFASSRACTRRRRDRAPGRRAPRRPRAAPRSAPRRPWSRRGSRRRPRAPRRRGSRARGRPRRRSRRAARGWRRSPRPRRRASGMSSRSGWPRRSSRPATGSTAIGSISARPSCCTPAKARFMAASPMPADASGARRRAAARALRRGAKRERLFGERRGSPRASMRGPCALMRGMSAGTTEISLHAQPDAGSARRAGRDASPPHTATCRPARARRPASPPRSAAAPRDAARRAARASSGWPRSIASVYCVRSLVPIERKSATSRRAASASSAAAGVSIITPSAGGASTPSRAAQHRGARARRATSPRR